MSKARYFVEHPPRCLAGLQPEPAALDGIDFDGHSAKWPNTVFRLGCPCGSRTHFVLGFLHPDPDPFGLPNALGPFVESPLALRCASCNRRAELVDMEHHGYDGEMGNNSANEPEGRRSKVGCPSCGGKQFEVFARFEYPTDLMDDVSEEWRGREQDLFSWFTLVVECQGCGTVGVVADEECA
jgi:hypothetical protein